MTLKATLIFVAIAIAANAFAATSVKTAAYSGKIQEQVLGDDCDVENNCNSVVKQVLGEATLKESQRYQKGSVTTLVLKAEQTAATRGKLDGADFVTLEMDMSKAMPVMDTTQVPVHMFVQTYSSEDEEMLFQAYNGGCTFSDTVTCRFSLNSSSTQRLFIEVK